MQTRVGMRVARYVSTYSLVLIAGLGILHCGCERFLANQTATLGGDTAGDRGTVTVLFINNTPHRAVFTYGTYDQTDPSYVPDFAQFRLDRGTTLDAGAASSIAGVNDDASLRCARVFSIGSSALLQLIQDNLTQDALDDVDEEAMLDGVEFFEIPREQTTNEGDATEENAGGQQNVSNLVGGDGAATGPAEDNAPQNAPPTEPVSMGAAPPFEALLGVDFPCNALLIIRFEIDDGDSGAPFRVDFELIPSGSDR
ncbi:MAG: hypothetical protein ACE5HE_04625 [Phycisphaerae bacterium]